MRQISNYKLAVMIIILITNGNPNNDFDLAGKCNAITTRLLGNISMVCRRTRYEDYILYIYILYTYVYTLYLPHVLLLYLLD